MSISEVTL